MISDSVVRDINPPPTDERADIESLVERIWGECEVMIMYHNGAHTPRIDHPPSGKAWVGEAYLTEAAADTEAELVGMPKMVEIVARHYCVD